MESEKQKYIKLNCQSCYHVNNLTKFTCHAVTAARTKAPFENSYYVYYNFETHHNIIIVLQNGLPSLYFYSHKVGFLNSAISSNLNAVSLTLLAKSWLLLHS